MALGSQAPVAGSEIAALSTLDPPQQEDAAGNQRAGPSRCNSITLHDPPTMFQLSPACRPISRAVSFRRLG